MNLKRYAEIIAGDKLDSIPGIVGKGVTVFYYTLAEMVCKSWAAVRFTVRHILWATESASVQR